MNWYEELHGSDRDDRGAPWPQRGPQPDDECQVCGKGSLVEYVTDGAAELICSVCGDCAAEMSEGDNGGMWS